MSRIKRWLYNKFLPALCKDGLMEANARLEGSVEGLKRENERLRSYINGMEAALRYQRRVTVRNEVMRE